LTSILLLFVLIHLPPVVTTAVEIWVYGGGETFLDIPTTNSCQRTVVFSGVVGHPAHLEH